MSFENYTGHIDTFDYEEYFTNKYGRVVERTLTEEELHILYSLCKTGQDNNVHFSLGFYPGAMDYCIHKMPSENKWIVSYSGERRDGDICGIFDNIYSAGVFLLESICNNKDTKSEYIINDFNEKIGNSISEVEITDMTKRLKLIKELS